jgi:nitrite reductase/ring-hydroxylating ferredoxin subunit
LEDLPASGSRGFAEASDGHGIFVVRKGNRVYGYRNRCPHTGAPLEWQPDQFLDFDGSFIQCALHGALFRIRDGYCLRGPCAGQGLESVEVRVEGDRVVFLGE